MRGDIWFDGLQKFLCSTLCCRALEPFFFLQLSKTLSSWQLPKKTEWGRWVQKKLGKDKSIYCRFWNFPGFCNNDLLKAFCRRKRSPQNFSHLMREQSNPLQLKKNFFWGMLAIQSYPFSLLHLQQVLVVLMSIFNNCRQTSSCKLGFSL